MKLMRGTANNVDCSKGRIEQVVVRRSRAGRSYRDSGVRAMINGIDAVPRQLKERGAVT